MIVSQHVINTTFLSIVTFYAAFMTSFFLCFLQRLRGPVGFGMIRIPLEFGRLVSCLNRTAGAGHNLVGSTTWAYCCRVNNRGAHAR